MTEFHDMSDSFEYRTWTNMKQRCYNPSNPEYQYYGARGIVVCERWLNSFSAFYSDMGPRPSDDHSIDRRDSDGNYEPDNCRWATDQQQSENRRNTRWVEFDGKKMTATELGRRSGISKATVINRLKAGQSPEEAARPSIELHTLGSESLTLKEWAKRHNRPYQTLCYRLRAGWSLEEALTTPSGKWRNRK